MTDDMTTIDLAELAADARADDMLQRVSFQPGIMLGSEAMNAEQSYHLRRLTRHQRWLTGPGTVFGMAVDVASNPLTGGLVDISLTVSPGYAIDGYGREVVVGEAYSISLTDWLAAENATPGLAQFYDQPSSTLFLRVTARARPCPTGLQPVVSELFDAGLDPVVAARIGDGFFLEISGDSARTADAPSRPLTAWSPDHTTPASGDVPGTVTARETATIAAITDPTLATAMKLQAWLLRRTMPSFDDSPGSEIQQAEVARLLLASVHVSLATLTDRPTAAGTLVNNLVRPFIRPNVLLAPLSLP